MGAQTRASRARCNRCRERPVTGKALPSVQSYPGPWAWTSEAKQVKATSPSPERASPPLPHSLLAPRYFQAEGGLPPGNSPKLSRPSPLPAQSILPLGSVCPTPTPTPAQSHRVCPGSQSRSTAVRAPPHPPARRGGWGRAIRCVHMCVHTTGAYPDPQLGLQGHEDCRTGPGPLRVEQGCPPPRPPLDGQRGLGRSRLGSHASSDV